MEINFMDNLKMERWMVLEFFIIKMVMFIGDNGKTRREMDLELIYINQVMLLRVNGWMVIELIMEINKLVIKIYLMFYRIKILIKTKGY